MVTIQRAKLEQQLIAAIAANLQRPELEQECIREFSAQLKTRIELEEKLARDAELNRPHLETERSELQRQARHLVDAIAMHGISTFISAQLETVESRLKEIERLLNAEPAAKLPTFTDEQIREFLQQERQNFCDALAGGSELARLEIHKRINKLIVTPKETLDGAVLEITGDVELFLGEDVLLGVPLEGIAEHYIGLPLCFQGCMLDPSLPLARSTFFRTHSASGTPGTGMACRKKHRSTMHRWWVSLGSSRAK